MKQLPTSSSSSSLSSLSSSDSFIKICRLNCCLPVAVAVLTCSSDFRGS